MTGRRASRSAEGASGVGVAAACERERSDAAGQHAKVTGQTVGLRLKPETYQHALNEGLTFDERIDPKLTGGSLRVVVVDVNSGRLGSVTVPSTAFQP